MDPATTTLDRLGRSECGLIERIENADDLHRLMAMGVCAGRTVEIVLPGDPLILRVFGSRIGLSARLARNVIVRPCPPTGRCFQMPSGLGEPGH
jgi:Fe2+ transport system protein FeoA